MFIGLSRRKIDCFYQILKCLGSKHSFFFINVQAITRSLNTISGGEFHGRVNPAIQISFDFLITSFGANWDLAGPGGLGTGLRVRAESGGLVDIGGITASYSGGFWGFVADEAFEIVALDELNPSVGVESFDMDNMVYSPVPEPSAMLLLGSGLVGLAGFRRFRKN